MHKQPTEVFYKKGVFKFTGKQHLCQSLYFDKVADLMPVLDSGTGVFCWFWEIFKNTFFYRTPLGDCV